MEKIFANMLKSMGFNPDDVKKQIEVAAMAFKKMAEQLDRIEAKQNEILNRGKENHHG